SFSRDWSSDVCSSDLVGRAGFAIPARMPITRPETPKANCTMTTIATPYYLIDKQKLLHNMEKIAHVRAASGAKALLALKCFATRSEERRVGKEYDSVE